MPDEMLPGESMVNTTSNGKVRIYRDDTQFDNGLVSGVHIISVDTGDGYEEVWRYLRFEEAAQAYLSLCFQLQRESHESLNLVPC